MLFNSLEFAIFLPITFGLYWAVRSRSLVLQNALVIVASYVFYGWWDWRFLSLIVFSSTVDYLVGLGLGSTDGVRQRRALLGVSLAANLGLLGFFKYYGFFAAELARGLEQLGLQANPTSLQVVLPVGISFYTFQTLSYTIDIYRRRIQPTRDVVAFFAFVSFFPQLVAGPIERAERLLPQFLTRRRFDYERARDGMRQILWGLFKKVVVADTCAAYVDQVFADPTAFRGSDLWVGTVFFAFQIYGDFSGYSDIALGVARLFGFELMNNFATPYFSRDVGEFWRRWHISLSTWFRDYVYIPLGGSRVSPLRRLGNVLVTFVVSGLWHGANWTFVVWGLLHGLAYAPLALRRTHRRREGIVAAAGGLPGVTELAGIGSTFAFTCVAWVFFRAESLGAAIDYLARMFSSSALAMPRHGVYAVPLIAVLVAAEWAARRRRHALETLPLSSTGRWLLYAALSVSILMALGNDRTFIYFQF